MNLPSEFSMILGVLPSMTATAEFVVPRSIPMTGPVTFWPSPLTFSVVAYPLLKQDIVGALYADERKVEVARGTAWRSSVTACVMWFGG